MAPIENITSVESYHAWMALISFWQSECIPCGLTHGSTPPLYITHRIHGHRQKPQCGPTKRRRRLHEWCIRRFICRFDSSKWVLYVKILGWGSILRSDGLLHFHAESFQGRSLLEYKLGMCRVHDISPSGSRRNLLPSVALQVLRPGCLQLSHPKECLSTTGLRMQKFLLLRKAVADGRGGVSFISKNCPEPLCALRLRHRTRKLRAPPKPKSCRFMS